MGDTDDTRRTTDDERQTTEAGQRQGYGISSPQVSYKIILLFRANENFEISMLFSSMDVKDKPKYQLNNIL